MVHLTCQDYNRSGGDEKMLNELLEIQNKFHGFSYPKAYIKAIELNLVDLDIWYIMDDKQVLLRLDGLQKRYPKRKLVPFARRDDNDDIACFEIDGGGKVIIIHDYANEGWEQRKEFSDFWCWFESAIKDMVAYSREEE
jgi:hypothetical protein